MHIIMALIVFYFLSENKRSNNKKNTLQQSNNDTELLDFEKQFFVDVFMEHKRHACL